MTMICLDSPHYQTNAPELTFKGENNVTISMPKQSSAIKQKVWRALEVEAVFEQLVSSTEGLISIESEQCLIRYGPDYLRPPKKQSSLKRFLRYFHNTLIHALLAASIVTALLVDWIEAA